MRKFGIHLNALRAFEAAARWESFSAAADELHISHSTISHHIKGLEQSLGVQLFERRNRKVVLTQAGEVLLPVLRQSFDEIAFTLGSLQSISEQPALRVTMTPSFAHRWFVPRLKRFREMRPDIEVQLNTSLWLNDYQRDRFDVGVRAGLGQWSGLNAELLTPIHMSPLCSPELLQKFMENGGLECQGADPKTHQNGLQNIALIKQSTLLHADVEEHRSIKSEWQAWLLALNIRDVDVSHGLSFRDPALAIQAAMDGLGIAMGYLELATEELAEGELVQPFAAQIKHPWSYHMVVPEGRTEDPQVRVFCEWLRSEIGLPQTPEF